MKNGRNLICQICRNLVKFAFAKKLIILLGKQSNVLHVKISIWMNKNKSYLITNSKWAVCQKEQYKIFFCYLKFVQSNTNPLLLSNKVDYNWNTVQLLIVRTFSVK